MNELTTVASFDTSMEAHVAKGALEAAGITCHLANERTVDAGPLGSTALGGVQLQVSARDAEKAKELLK